MVDNKSESRSIPRWAHTCSGRYAPWKRPSKTTTLRATLYRWISRSTAAETRKWITKFPDLQSRVERRRRALKNADWKRWKPHCAAGNA